MQRLTETFARKVPQTKIGALTLEVAMESYLSRPKLRSEAHKHAVRLQFDKHLKDWLKLPLDEITKSMVAERHRSMAATPSAANHTLKYFRTVWNHARRLHDLPESPTMAIEWIEEKPKSTIVEDLKQWRSFDLPILQLHHEILAPVW
jgi:hypothetical protein